MKKSSVIKTNFGEISTQQLPTPPDVALRIVQACADPNFDGRTLENIVSRDPALMAEILRWANSAYFGRQGRVTRAEHVLTALGTRALRNITLLFMTRETFRSSAIPDAVTRSYWEDSVRRAVCARILAESRGLNPDDGFTLGMLQDIGLLGLMVACPTCLSKWASLRQSNPEDRLRLEAETFGAMHDAVGQTLAQSWGFPEEITNAIAEHHDLNRYDMPTAGEHMMSRVASGADWMASIYTASDKRLALARCRKFLGDYFDLDQDESDALLAQVPAGVKEVAEIIGAHIEQISFAEMLQYANRHFIMESTATDEHIQRVEQALNEREMLAAELQKAYHQLSRIAFLDPLTTLFNRRRFQEVFRSEISRHRRAGLPLSVIMMDIDGFKQLNDKYGHHFGDEVLRSVAEVLVSTLRVSDVAARIGGDEMCMLLPDTDVAGGRCAAERMRIAVQQVRLEEEVPMEVTSSFGGCTLLGPKLMNDSLEIVMKNVLSAADKALYTSKQEGRNRVNWQEAF